MKKNLEKNIHQKLKTSKVGRKIIIKFYENKLQNIQKLIIT